jgi:hypothetical protein
MLTVKEAVQAAEKWVRDLYPKKDIQHLRLEEVERSDDERYWLITLGWVEPAVREPTSLGAMFTHDLRTLPRVYKTLEIDAESGTVKSMKIREVA